MTYTKERTKYLVAFLKTLAKREDNIYASDILRETAKVLTVLSAYTCCELDLINQPHAYDCENYGNPRRN